MTTSRMQQLGGFNDPRLESFAQRMGNLLVLAAVKAACHIGNPSRFPLPTDDQSLEHIFHRRLLSLHVTKQKTAVQNAQQLVDAPTDVKNQKFLELAKLNLMSREPLELQIRRVPSTMDLRQAILETKSPRELFRPYIRWINSGENPSNGSSPLSGAPILATTIPTRPTSLHELTLFISLREFRCVDQTGTEPFSETGEDEIRLSGITIDAQGRIQQLENIRIKNDQGDDFEDNETRFFEPPRGYAAINLTDGIAFPKSAFVVFTLIEEDNGGFADFLNSLYSHVRERVVQELAAQGFAVGSIGGPLGAIVGAIVGAAIGFAVNCVVDYIVNAWNDDVFPPQMIEEQLDAIYPEDSLPYGLEEDAPIEFSGHDGFYRLWINSRLVTAVIT